MPGRNFVLRGCHAQAAVVPAALGVELLHLGEIRNEVDLVLEKHQDVQGQLVPHGLAIDGLAGGKQRRVPCR